MIVEEIYLKGCYLLTPKVFEDDRGFFLETFNQRVFTEETGKVLDVCVDIRKNSLTFGKHFSVILDEANKKQLYIPRGFAHGFIALENNTVFYYKCDNYYNKDAESGIIFNDKALNIDWGIDEEKMIISNKDLMLSTFEKLF